MTDAVINCAAPQSVKTRKTKGAFRAAEFFAGIGLVRKAIETEGFRVVFANDIEPDKHALYAANFEAGHFVLGDVRAIRGDGIPDIDLATASFPCTDLSLAGNRAGLAGEGSGMFWEFARVIEEMRSRRPRAVMLENVVGFATSHGGKDIAAAISRLNELGYVCGMFVLDAKNFVPQSRLRLFIVGSRRPYAGTAEWSESGLRPAWIKAFVEAHPNLKMQPLSIAAPTRIKSSLDSCVEKLAHNDLRWWDDERLGKFTESLSPLQSERLISMMRGREKSWATAYRRTRNGVAVWEIRPDSVSGCLRTARGGSSKQAVVEAGNGRVRVRWMLAKEYARLQGAPDFNIDGFRESAAIFGFGDAVCVPAIAWIARNYLAPMLGGKLT